jgi:hypothetical protein
VPLAAWKLWLVPVNEDPANQLSVVVFSTATEMPVMAAVGPEFDEAVPVIEPVQFVP